MEYGMLKFYTTFYLLTLPGLSLLPFTLFSLFSLFPLFSLFSSPFFLLPFPFMPFLFNSLTL